MRANGNMTDANRVNVPATFAAPKPVAISVCSRLRRGDVCDRLARAIGDYHETDSGSPRYFGLEGSATAGRIRLRSARVARPPCAKVDEIVRIILEPIVADS